MIFLAAHLWLRITGGQIRRAGLLGWALLLAWQSQSWPWISQVRCLAGLLLSLVGNPLLLLAVLADRCHAAEWSGQDGLPALLTLVLLGTVSRWSNPRMSVMLALIWVFQFWSDRLGPWGWARPQGPRRRSGALPPSPSTAWPWRVASCSSPAFPSGTG